MYVNPIPKLKPEMVHECKLKLTLSSTTGNINQWLYAKLNEPWNDDMNRLLSCVGIQWPTMAYIAGQVSPEATPCIDLKIISNDQCKPANQGMNKEHIPVANCEKPNTNLVPNFWAKTPPTT